MKRYALKIFYIGSRYHGFAIQPDKLTVEGELITALKKCGYIKDRKNAKINYASRTDKGVHAVSQVFAFNSLKPLIPMHVNSFLPPDITVWAYASVEDKFNARKDATERHYLYVLPIISSVSIKKIEEASSLFEGQHDFSSFMRKRQKVIWEIKEFKVSQPHGSLLYIEIKAPSFTRGMILKMVGSLIMVGLGKISLRDLENALEGKTTLNITPAPAEGLILLNVKYREDICFQVEPKALERALNKLQDEIKNLITKTSSRYVLFSLLKSIGHAFL